MAGCEEAMGSTTPSFYTHWLSTYYAPGATKAQTGNVIPALSSGFRARGQNCHYWGPEAPVSPPASADPYMRPLHDLREPVEMGSLTFGQHSQTHTLNQSSQPAAKVCFAVWTPIPQHGSQLSPAFPLFIKILKVKFTKCIHLKSTDWWLYICTHQSSPCPDQDIEHS